jgi:hypothetical protein
VVSEVARRRPDDRTGGELEAPREAPTPEVLVAERAVERIRRRACDAKFLEQVGQGARVEPTGLGVEVLFESPRANRSARYAKILSLSQR